MKKLFLLCLSVALSAPGLSFAEKKISQSQAILAELHDPASEENERIIRVKELESGKVTQLTLSRDPSTPEVWSGYFVIQFFAGDSSARTLDFVTPQGVSYFASITQEKTLQKVILFNTPSELAMYEAKSAEAQQKAVEAEHKAAEKKLSQQIRLAQPKTNLGPINKEKAEELVRQQGRLQENAQLSLEESQAKKRMALLEQKQKMSEQKKQEQAQQAAALAKKADAAYTARKYKEASALYAQASELNPATDDYYYRYGVTLYKTGNYNRSLAILSMSEVKDEQALERDYYIALNHLKLKDYDKARKEFVEIREENSVPLSPMSSFFAGNIEFQQQKFPEARKSMEYVLDNGKDPALDKSAENMLEQIDRMEAYYESQKEKYRFSFYSGIVYDSNILNIAENNISTDVRAWRLSYGGSALAYLYRTPTSDLAAQLSLADYYSLNSTFQGDATVQTADAMEVGLNLPFHQEMKFGAKTYSFEAVPSYKNILLSTTGGTRSVAVKSTGLSTSVFTAIKADFMMSGRLDLSSDQSTLESSVGDNDLSGTKYGLTLIPVKLLSLKGDQVLSGEVGYLMNNTLGKNNRYQRTAAAVTYVFPSFSKGTMSVRADYSLQDYLDATTPRKDTVFLFTASYNKNLTKTWNWLFSVQGTNANSELESYKYNKFMVSSLFTYTTSILSK